MRHAAAAWSDQVCTARQPAALHLRALRVACGAGPRGPRDAVGSKSITSVSSRPATVSPPPLGDEPQQPPTYSTASSLPPRQPTGLQGMELNVLQAKVLYKRFLKDLSSLPRAIALMAATFGFSALGTIIPQNKAFEYYVQNYPASQKVLGFLDYNLLLTLDLNHIYTAWYFYLTLAWLGASLAACTSTRQWPAVKVAQRWRFQTQPASVVKQGRDDKGMAEVLPGARVQDLALQLMMRDYQVFVQGRSLYAFKGLAGRLGPIGVHAAMLLVLAGTSYSGFGGFKGTVMLPEGEEVRVEDVISPVSRVAMMPGGASKVLHVNGFSIDYRPDGSVAQFYSDLSMLDPDQAPALVDMSDPSSSSGQEVLRKRISVNSPLRYKGLTMYQTDWSLAALNLRVLGPDPDAPAPLSPDTSTSDSAASPSSTPSFTDASSSPNPNAASPASSSRGGSPLAAGEADRRSGLVADWTVDSSEEGGTLLRLPMASLEGKPGITGRLWGSYLPVAAQDLEQQQAGMAPRGVSILARDPQSVIFYDSKGQFVGVRRPGSGKPISVEGVQLVAEGVVGATGLEIKSDPGVPWVYAGFGGLMITTLVSYLSHSQVWALQEGEGPVGTLYVAGRSNRAVLSFRDEMDAVLEAVPELSTEPS